MPTALQPEHLKKEGIIGRGSYGEVFKGIDMKTGKSVAIKVVNLDADHEGIDEIRREVSVLCHCDSAYIIKYHESILVGSRLWIVMDYCGFGSLRQIIDTLGPISEDLLPFIAKSVLKALAYLHDNRIIHRDVKAANILVTENGFLRLGDFGVASQVISRVRRGTLVGSPYWMAPEVIQERAYDTKADIWSFGISMYEILTGNPPLHNMSASETIRTLSSAGKAIPKLEGKFSKETIQFINQCFEEDPKKRPSAFEMLKSKFFRGVRTNVSRSPLMTLAKKYSELRKHGLQESPGTVRSSPDFNNPWDFNSLED